MNEVIRIRYDNNIKAVSVFGFHVTTTYAGMLEVTNMVCFKVSVNDTDSIAFLKTLQCETISQTIDYYNLTFCVQQWFVSDQRNTDFVEVVVTSIADPVRNLIRQETSNIDLTQLA